MTYVTHARTLEELRAEVVSDIDRRLEMLQNQSNVVGTAAAEKARIARAYNELRDMRRYWSEVHLVKSKRKTEGKAERI